jgi:hypothetical protein
MNQEIPTDLQELFSRHFLDVSMDGQDSASVFERFSLELLRAHLEAQGKGLTLDVRVRDLYRSRDLLADALAIDGFDGLAGPVVIEVKFLTRASSLLPVLRQVIERLVFMRGTISFATAIVVVNQEPSSSILRQAADLAKIRAPTLALEVWGPKKLMAIAGEHPDLLRLLLGNLPNVDTAKAVQQAAQGRSDDWKSRTRALLEDLRSAWRNNDLVPFLGAGASIDAGVPSWSSLLNQLLVAMVEKMGDDGNFTISLSEEKRQEIAQRLQGLQDSSPLLAARYIRSGLDGRFAPALRRALYSAVNKDPSSQLAALARLCVPRRNGSGVHAVVTYNFDNLLEQILIDKGIQHQPVYLRGTRVPAERLAIYHVHGFLPQQQPDDEEPTDSLVVFSEERYHGLYNDPYSWSNTVQLNLLSEHTCVFIGLSMNDPNLRRLLEIAARNDEKPRHVALLRRITVEKLIKDDGDEGRRTASSQLDPHVAAAVLAAHHNLIERSFEELGVRVAWFESFSEIAGMLDLIRQPLG